jgi:hypothetical protein
MTNSQHVYEIRPRKDKRGVDEAGNVIETELLIEQFQA